MSGAVHTRVGIAIIQKGKVDKDIYAVYWVVNTGLQCGGYEAELGSVSEFGVGGA